MDNAFIYLIGIVGALAVIGLALLFDKKGINIWRKKASVTPKGGPLPESKEEEVSETPPVFCRVYDAITRTISNQELPGKVVDDIRAEYGNLGRKWNRDGKQVYAIDKFQEPGTNIVKYAPVRPKVSLDNSAGRLFRALQQHDATVAYDATEKKSFLTENGKYILFVGVVLFMMWTIIMQ